MSAFKELWKKLEDKKYRTSFVANLVKRCIPFQIRAIMTKKELSQQLLAERSGLSQGVVSRAVDPNYGNLTLNTVIRVAGGLDVAFVGLFVPFSELGKWTVRMSDEAIGS